MSGYSVLHVPADLEPELLERVRSVVAEVAGPAGGWVGVDGAVSLQVDPEAIPELGRALSKRLETTVVGVFVESVSDCFGFWRFERGEPTRVLRYGIGSTPDEREDRVWYEASGTPEPWEDPALFAEGPELEELLDFTEESDRNRRRELHATKRIDVGGYDPGIDARAVGEVVLRHYGIELGGPEVTVVRTPWSTTVREVWSTLALIGAGFREAIEMRPDESVAVPGCGAIALLALPIVALWTRDTDATAWWLLVSWGLATVLALLAARNAWRERAALEPEIRLWGWLSLVAVTAGWIWMLSRG